MKFVHIADMHFDTPFATLNKNGFSRAKKNRTKKNIN